jgi:hypothetical protein
MLWKGGVVGFYMGIKCGGGLFGFIHDDVVL